MINNLQNRSFGASKIIISPRAVSDKCLSKLAKRGNTIGAPYTLNESRYFAEEAATDSIALCATAILRAKGGKEFRFDHLDPDKNNWYRVRNQLEEAQERLCAGSNGVPLEGFLFGANFDYTSSKEQAMNLLRYFQETGVRFSAFLGQRSLGNARLYHSLPKDEIRLSFPRCGEIQNIKDLGNKFEEVVIGDNEIQLGEKNKGALIDRLFGFVRGQGL